MAGLGKMMKQMAKLQKQMTSLQEDLGQKNIEISSGGAIKVTISLQQEVRKISIDPEFLKEEASVVEDALLEAIQLALKESRKQSEDAMQELTSGLQMPGLM